VLFPVCDDLRKGAALNAIQVAELLVGAPLPSLPALSSAGTPSAAAWTMSQSTNEWYEIPPAPKDLERAETDARWFAEQLDDALDIEGLLT
jgi:hypothetical protein